MSEGPAPSPSAVDLHWSAGDAAGADIAPPAITPSGIDADGRTAEGGTVRAQLWVGEDGFALHELPTPALGPGEVLVRVRTAAICGSDRHTVAGLRESPCPGVLGHEGVGEVVALGAGPVPADVSGRPLAAGDRVVWSVISACGRCDRCRAGRSAKCRRLRKAGHEAFAGNWPLSGSYATHVLLPAGHDVVRVGPEVSDGAAAISACAGATVMAALEAAGRSTELSGARVLASGVGMLGLLAVLAARAAGAATVHAVDPSPARRALALRAGADSTAAPGGRAPADGTPSEHGTMPQDGVMPEDGTSPLVDVALEFSGAPQSVGTVLDALDVGGTAVLAGSVFPGPAVGLDPEALVRGWRTVTGVHNYEPHHLVQAVELLGRPGAAVLEDPEVLSAPLPLEELPGAFTVPSAHLRTLVAP